MQSKLISDFKEGTRIHEFYPAKDKSGLLAQIQFAGHEYLGPKYYINRKGFESFLLTLVASGSVKIVIDNVVRTIGKGELIFLDCLKGQVSWTEPPSDGSSLSAEIYYLHFYPNEWIRDLHQYLAPLGSIISLGDDDIGYKKLVLDVLDAMDNKTFDEWEFSKRIYEAFCLLLKTAESKKTIGISAPIQKCISFISDNYDQKICLSELAKTAFLSPNYLEDLFRKTMGQTIFSYIGDYRFHKSAELLLQSTLSIEEIAERVGLTERKTLIRLYKKSIGMTPLAYRKFYNLAHPKPENIEDGKKHDLPNGG